LVAEQVEDSQLDVVIEAGSIDTGLAMRDSHLRSADFLDAAHYPYLRFTSDRFKYHGGTQWTISGVLNLHGVARTIRLDTDYLGIGTGMEGEARAACKASTELHREDFTLNWQKMLTRGIAAIGSTIRIELDVQAVQAVQQLP
jgi:polyisoprenoid-binding protein YceI